MILIQEDSGTILYSRASQFIRETLHGIILRNKSKTFSLLDREASLEPSVLVQCTLGLQLPAEPPLQTLPLLDLDAENKNPISVHYLNSEKQHFVWTVKSGKIGMK